MTAIANVYPKVRIEAPGVPEPLLADVVADAMRDFFRDSEAWRHTVPLLLDWTTTQTFPDLVAGTELPADTRLKRVDEVKYANDGQNLKPVPFKTRQQLDGLYPNWEVRTGTHPNCWTNDGNAATPRIVPIANADVTGSVQVRAIVVPTATMTDVPDYFYDEFHDLWRFGALARLLKMPGKDWTNEPLAGYYANLERDGVREAKSKAKAEYGQPDRTMTYGGIDGDSYSGVDDYGR